MLLTGKSESSLSAPLIVTFDKEMRKRKLKVGDWVEVRSKDDILKTLDSNGRLDGMPFMPEMFRFCGNRFQVLKRAHKTCDYSGPVAGARRVVGAVHLATRCDGDAHNGCQAGCLIYWKDAWLKSVEDADKDAAPSNLISHREQTSGAIPLHFCRESDVAAGTYRVDPASGEREYVCQATEVPRATRPLAWWDVRQYVEDYLSGNVGIRRLLASLVYSVYYNLSQAGIGIGAPMRWLYDKLRPLWGGSRWPKAGGIIPEGQPTPTRTLGLEPGELVRVKSHDEILATVTVGNVNRGMYWDAELVPYCGGTYRVLKRVTRIIDEKTGRMLQMKTPCIVLDSVVCQARYTSGRMLCPKSMYPYWREIWLERIETGEPQPLLKAH